MDKHERIIAITGFLAATIGTLNSIARGKGWPGSRFWIGLGMFYVVVSALAEVEPGVAEPLSIAALTTIVLGEGDGVLSFISKRGEFDTKAPKSKPNPNASKNPSPSGTPGGVPGTALPTNKQVGPNLSSPQISHLLNQIHL